MKAQGELHVICFLPRRRFPARLLISPSALPLPGESSMPTEWPKTAFCRLSLSAILVAGGSDAFAQQQLSEVELRELITGKVAHWDSGNLTEYHAHGTFTFKSVNTISGTWEISGGKLCYHRPNLTLPNCDQFYRDSTGPYIVSNRGVKYRFKVAAQ